jgi:hypothetical protein
VLKEKTVYELKTICMTFDVEYPKNAKKAEIIKAIEEAGITEEQLLKDEELTASIDAPEVEEVLPEILEKPVVETAKETDIVLKMVHDRGALNSGNGIIFTKEKPFIVLKESLARKIIERSRGEVREATKEEVAYFYGIE